MPDPTPIWVSCETHDYGDRGYASHFNELSLKRILRVGPGNGGKSSGPNPAPPSSGSLQSCRHAAVYRKCGGGTRRQRLEERLSWGAADIVVKGELLNFLPDDAVRKILTHVPYEYACRLKAVSKGMKEFIECDAYHSLRGEAVPIEGSFTAVHVTRNEGIKWQCRGFDLLSNRWRMFPPFLIPLQSSNSSPQYLIAGGGGLLCFLSVSDSSAERLFIVCNPFTQKTRALSASGLHWKPMILHLLSNRRTMSYKVIVAGYSRMGSGEISIHVIIFDSTTSTWTTMTSYISGTDLRIKQYQTGAVLEDRLYCIAEDRQGTRYVLQCNLDTRTWSEERIPLPLDQQSATPNRSTDEAQLVACNGKVYLYSRRGSTYKVRNLYKGVLPWTGEYHWERLQWREIKRFEKTESCPKYTFAPFGADKLCVFNTKDVAGFVFDIHKHLSSELPSLNKQVNDITTFGIQNPMNFLMQPNYEEQP